MKPMQAWHPIRPPSFGGGPDRRSSLHSPTNNLGNNFNNNSLGGEGRQVSWVSPSPRDLGGDPTATSLGSKSASSWHIALLALEECMTKELELTATTHMLTSLESDGHLVMLLDSFNQETLKSFELGKGLVDHEHVKTKRSNRSLQLNSLQADKRTNKRRTNAA